MPFLATVQPGDYHDALEAAIGGWWYFLTFLLPALVYFIPALNRWRSILGLIPVAFLAACLGYLVYWRSIDWALMDYYRRTGYINTVDTWYVFMPIFRGIPNALAATTVCTLVAWAVSLRGKQSITTRREPSAEDTSISDQLPSNNPYETPRW